jgi:D-alanine-D-alanine ligase
MVMQSVGLPQVRSVILDYSAMNQEELADGMKNIRYLRLPLFVKPSRLGSSVGISKVKTLDDLEAALTEAKKYDNRVIVEEAVVDPREIEVSVLGNDAASIEISLPGEIKPAADFYTYDDKYFDGKATDQIPADLSDEMTKKIIDLARKAYIVTDCQGFARVDFLLSDDQVFINEINTIPGFTPISMYPKLWEARGLSYQNLITKLIELGLETRY